MQLRKILFVGLSILAGACGGETSRGPAAVARSGFSVLYAGPPEGPRSQAWLAFLRARFETVAHVPLPRLTREMAKPHDVVIADWFRRYADGRYAAPPRHDFELPRNFDTPVVMVGAVAGEIARWSKIGWL